MFILRFIVISLVATSSLIGVSVQATPKEHPFLPTHAVTSRGGINFWLIEDHTQPILALQFGFSGAGTKNDTLLTQGRARLLANTLDEGAGPYDSQKFQAALENDAIQLSFNVSRDHFYGAVKTLTDTAERAATMTRLALTDPHLTDADVKRMADANLTRIRSSQTDPEWLATRLLNDKVFDQHPYGLNSGGTLSTLPTLTAAQLHDFKKHYLTRDRLKIAIVGDITAEQAGLMIDKIFGDLPATGPTNSPSNPATVHHTGQTFLYRKDIPQTIIMMTAAAPTRNDPDFVPFMVMNNILGGSGFGSRLMERIREKSGLTYGIYSSHTTMDEIGLISIQTSTRNDQVETLINMIWQEIKKLQQTPITATELKETKGYLSGSMPMALTSTDQIASLLLEEQLDQRPLDGIDKLRRELQNITESEINRIAKKWLDPQRFITILVGQPNPIKNIEVIDKINNIE